MSPTISQRTHEKKPPGRPEGRPTALAQMTFVEHALCPLDPRTSLRPGAVFRTRYYYTDPGRHTRLARVEVSCSRGLLASDEFFLWGLLALTLARGRDAIELVATPHECLRRLGLIDHLTRRGGRQYLRFLSAIGRLSALRYRNDTFFDPVRREHREVRFGILACRPPRAGIGRRWRFIWDPAFLEAVRSRGGCIRFDLATYASLDPASRRLFLFLVKVFPRRATTPRMSVRHLGEHLLGFSPTLSTSAMKSKLARVVARLASIGVVMGEKQVFEKRGRGDYSVVLARGPYFAQRELPATAGAGGSTVLGLLGDLGFDPASARRLVGRHPPRLLRNWIDVTLSARKKFGEGFFRKSPQAYLIDNLKHAALGNRTPPDWWHELRKQRPSPGRSGAANRDGGTPAAPGPVLSGVREEIRACFLATGQEGADASRNAERFARELADRMETIPEEDEAGITKR